MLLSTEIFVLVVFLLALPVFMLLFKSTGFPSSGCFLAAFVCLLFSNIFTVAEMWFYPDIFNLLEHLSIAFSSILFFTALRIFIQARSKSAEPSTGKPR